MSILTATLIGEVNINVVKIRFSMVGLTNDLYKLFCKYDIHSNGEISSYSFSKSFSDVLILIIKCIKLYFCIQFPVTV